MRTIAIIKRVMLEMLRDKRTLALMLVAPLLILTLLYYLFQGVGTTSADLGVRAVDSRLVAALKSDSLAVHMVPASGNDASTSAEHIIRDNDYAGLLEQHGSTLTLTLAGDEISKNALIEQRLHAAQVTLQAKAAETTIAAQAQALTALQQQLESLTATLKAANIPLATPMPVAPTQPLVPSKSAPATVSVHYLYGTKDSTFFTNLLPVLMAFVVFFFVFIISGMALLHERTTGTLYRLLATPITFREILGGYLAGYGLFAVIQTCLIMLFAIQVFKIQILGGLWLVMLISMLIALTALALGLLISAFAKTEFQMMQFIPIIIIPQIFFSGLISVDSMPRWLQVIAHIMPLYWGATSMSDVIERGSGFSDVAPHLMVLVGFLIVFFALNMLTMRTLRRSGTRGKLLRRLRGPHALHSSRTRAER
ncbi:MAG: ABC transporter permease [Bifidobacterium tibiigranuli]|jgi:ABC-2 type transport system permease protein|uniref:ABC transporter permease n=1 Tax=Bifidobacterium tibiigranuli TaxID=2172043 RepID=UPI00235209E3|nr:ABC transporter permease [Bifidobacterium tibiigranuli]MCH3974308.1 ABC transporter permease [Bifidobacterium tibiigranuli]MCH4188871.1 ABC transporter permease [Bifidobacterium tibiigranuli]MCH4203224.1 ABC transporter permease [Bifidobacterium tibiigranuli]MCH4273457.1 ABC transporter permease [Bifidobacterium tibiigranuli]MCI1790571.1 ABC transporter permease [Bifidobacterium tibiigranuli]